MKDKDIPDVIDYAMNLKKDTIIFYYEIKERLRGDRARKLVDVIIDVEKKHVLKLISIKGM